MRLAYDLNMNTPAELLASSYDTSSYNVSHYRNVQVLMTITNN